MPLHLFFELCQLLIDLGEFLKRRQKTGSLLTESKSIRFELDVPPALPEITTDPIREAWWRVKELLREAETRADEICTSDEDWTSRARGAMDAVIRKSIEMRLVATHTTD